MKNKLQFIEGIRGLAALIVIFQHIVLIFYPALYSGNSAKAHFLNPRLEHNIAISPLSIFYNGNFAVCLFFVLSGFVLSYKYFKTNDAHLLLEYSVKRYFRLLIPVAFSIVFILIMLAVFHPDMVHLETYTHAGDWLKNFFKTKPTVPDVVYNILIDVFVNESTKYNPVLWTMGIEFLGSLLLFAVLKLSHSIKNKSIVLIAMIGFLIISGDHFYAAFFLGALICLAFVKTSEKPKKNSLLIIGLFLFGIYFGSYPTASQYLLDSIYFPLQFSNFNVMNLSLVIGSALLIFMITRSEICQKIFSWKLFAFLGKISFSSYLIHIVILLIISTKLFPLFIVSNSYHLSFLMCAIISIVITYIISWLVYKFIDQPTVKLSNLISKKAIDFLNK